MKIVYTVFIAAGLGFLVVSSSGAQESAVTIDPTVRALVQAECKGPWETRNDCLDCVESAVDGLLEEHVITKKEGTALVKSFKSNECRAQCIPTTCAIEGRTFGSISDLCGGTLDCGPPPGPDLQLCGCQDGALITICAQVDCSSGPAHDVVCGPVCALHGGESGTGCVSASPACTGQ